MISMVEPTKELDAAYEAMVETIDHWEIVGPMRIQGMDGVYMVRSKMRLEDLKVPEDNTPQVVNDNVQFLHFRDLAHAAAFIQYQGMAAAITKSRDTR